MEQPFRHDELQDGVSQEFEALIVQMIALRLVTHAGMRQGFRQQKTVAKCVADSFFERGHFNQSLPHPMGTCHDGTTNAKPCRRCRVVIRFRVPYGTNFSRRAYYWSLRPIFFRAALRTRHAFFPR